MHVCTHVGQRAHFNDVAGAEGRERGGIIDVVAPTCTWRTSRDWLLHSVAERSSTTSVARNGIGMLPALQRINRACPGEAPDHVTTPRSSSLDHLDVHILFLYHTGVIAIGQAQLLDLRQSHNHTKRHNHCTPDGLYDDFPPKQGAPYHRCVYHMR